MKKNVKLAALFAVIILLLCAVTVFAFAESDKGETRAHKTAIAENSYLFYDASANSFTVYKSANSDGNSENGLEMPILTRLTQMDHGDTLLLLSDIATQGGWNSASTNGESTPANSIKGIYLDLNGYQLSIDYDDDSSPYLIHLSANTDLYVYSSDTENTASLHGYAEDADGAQRTGTALFNMRYSNAHLYIGAVPAAQLISGGLGSWNVRYETGSPVSADKFETYTVGQLFTSYSAKSDAKNSSMTLIGGRHYQMTGGSLFTLYNGVDVAVDGAELISIAGGSIFSYSRSNSLHSSGACYTAAADANLTVTDTVIYTDGKFLSNGYEAEADADKNVKANSIIFRDSYIYSAGGSTMTLGSPELDNCYFSHGNFAYSESERIAKTYRTASVTLASRTRESSNKAWEMTAGESLTFAARFVTTAPENMVSITWKTPFGDTAERWMKGEDIIPTSSLTPPSSKLYAYSYGSAIAPTSEGDAVYTLKSHINFTVRANILLYSDFVYNMYIPKSAADSDGFASVRVDSVDYDGNVTEGSPLSLSSLETRDIQITSDVTETYYVIPTFIQAAEGDREYRLVTEIVGYYGETIEHAIDFSIADYAERVNAGNYSASAKKMVSATLTYIKAARNYSASEGGRLPYPTSENEDLLTAVGAASRSEAPEMSSAVSQVIAAVTTSPADKFSFVFYFHPDTDDTVTFTYPVYTQPTSVTVTADDLTPCKLLGEDMLCYEITLRALDIRRKISIDLLSTGEGEDFSYSLANYAYSMYTDGTSSLDGLIDTLWLYSKAAYDYAVDESTADTPTVSMSIAGNAVSEESHYILVKNAAAHDAAEALKTAIEAKCGIALTVSDTEISGKCAIVLDIKGPDIYSDFTAEVIGDELVLSSSFASFIDTATNSFIEKNIRALGTDISFGTSFEDNYYTDRVYYSDFGAMGVDMTALTATFGEKYRDVSIWYGDDLELIRDHLTNDFAAMREAHIFANASQRHTVYADEDATYYIGSTIINGSARQITVQSPVNFGNARIIIDDSIVYPYYDEDHAEAYSIGRSHIFIVTPEESAITIANSELLSAIVGNGINSTTKRLDLGLGYSAMLVIKDSSHKVFRRRGYGQWSGADMQELVVVDEYGNIDPSTALIFDYTRLDSITVRKIDIPELKIEGGNFTTIAPSVNCDVFNEVVIGGKTYYELVEQKSGSVARGLSVQRSNTLVTGLKHNVIGEYSMDKQKGKTTTVSGTTYYTEPSFNFPAYSGFFVVGNAHNVTFYDCGLQSRRYNRGSTYEISLSMVNDIVFDKCIQNNFYIDKTTGQPSAKNDPNSIIGIYNNTCWGAAGTNYCKNMSYIDSVISRYDAHSGLYNGSIIGTTIADIEIVGFGTMLIEDSEIYKFGGSTSGPGVSNSLIYLRDDYASTWDGEIIFRNVKAFHYETSSYTFENGGAQTKYSPAIYYHSYQNWYYGYTSYFPNTVVDNLTYHSLVTDKANAVYGTGNPTLITAEKFGAVGIVGTGSIYGEPNLHLQATAKQCAIFPVIDEDDDGYIDHSETFDQTGDGKCAGYTVEAGKGIKIDDFTGDVTRGITSELYVNNNRIVPPASFIILNDSEGYDYSTKFEEYGKTTSFFKDTYIFRGKISEDGSIIPVDVINQGKGEISSNKYKIKNDDTPIVPYN